MKGGMWGETDGNINTSKGWSKIVGSAEQLFNHEEIEGT